LNIAPSIEKGGEKKKWVRRCRERKKKRGGREALGLNWSGHALSPCPIGGKKKKTRGSLQCQRKKEREKKGATFVHVHRNAAPGKETRRKEKEHGRIAYVGETRKEKGKKKEETVYHKTFHAIFARPEKEKKKKGKGNHKRA